MWASTLSMGIRAVRRNTLRSVLTALGVVIGVASVIAMITLGQSATARITAEISSLGTNMMMVAPGSDTQGPVAVTAAAFDLNDVRAIARELPDLVGLAPVTNRDVLAVYGSVNYNTIANGATNDFLRVRGFRVASGREFSEQESASGSSVCIVAETVRRELFGAQDPVGSTLRIGAVACLVIGVLAPKGASIFGGDQDDFIVMPLRAAQRRLAGNSEVTMIYASVAEESAMARAKAQLRAVLQERRQLQPGQKDNFTIEDTRELTNKVGSVTGILTLFLGAVAAISLLVGGIGIMNIMLVSVTERTREIGLRLAIGALGREVLSQFLLESILLCVGGGMLGVTLGLGGSWVAARLLEFPFSIDLRVVAFAFAFSASLGVVFGYIPARKASRLNPIEALRHE